MAYACLFIEGEKTCQRCQYQRQKCSGPSNEHFEAYVSTEDEPDGLDEKWRAKVVELLNRLKASSKVIKIEPGTGAVVSKKRKAIPKVPGTVGEASPPMKSKFDSPGFVSSRVLISSLAGSRSGRGPSPGPSALSATTATLPTQPTDDLLGKLATFEQIASEGTPDSLARGRALLEARVVELNARARGQHASDALEPYAVRRDRLFAMATMRPVSQAAIPSVEPPVSDARIVESILELRDRLNAEIEAKTATVNWLNVQLNGFLGLADDYTGPAFGDSAPWRPTAVNIASATATGPEVGEGKGKGRSVPEVMPVRQRSTRRTAKD